MIARPEKKWVNLVLPFGLAAVVVLGGGRVTSAGMTATTVQAARDTACIDQLGALDLSPGSFSFVDNGIVRDTIVTPNPGLTQNAQYVGARRCVARVDSIRRHPEPLMPDYSRLAMIHTMIPEYHDEQRLPDGAGGLGPKAHLFASPNLAGFRHPWQFAEHRSDGVLVAHVFVDPLRGETVPQWYVDLGLLPGLNCVWLARVTGATSYRAFVRPVNPRGVCDKRVTRVVQLEVKTSHSGAADSLYPPVARFSESAEGKPLLGVRCLNAWCEIGTSPFTLRAPVPAMFGDVSDRATIKGWHDEQVLSIRNPADRRVFVPTSAPMLRAALVPRDGVELLSSADFDGRWQAVGNLYLETEPPAGSKYATWGLKYGRNTVYVRRFNWGWGVRMSNATNQRVWRLTQRDFHEDAAIPGTARFRWTIGDDGIWLPCGQHCCHMEG